MAYEGNDSLYMGLTPEAWQKFGNSEGMVGDGSMGGDLLQKGFDLESMNTGLDFSKMFEKGTSSLGGGIGTITSGIQNMFGSGYGETNGLMSLASLGLGYLGAQENKKNNEMTRKEKQQKYDINNQLFADKQYDRKHLQNIMA